MLHLPINIQESKNVYGSISQCKNELSKKMTLKRRWYIAFIFSLFCLGQGAVSNTWGPISSTAEEVYGWKDGTIALFSVLNSCIFLIAFLPIVKLMMHVGIRHTTLLCAFLMVMGTGLRCLHVRASLTRGFGFSSAVCSGIANTLSMIGPTTISRSWFAPNQRTMATAGINALGNNLANVASFLLAKLTVNYYNVTENLSEVAFNSTYNLTDGNVMVDVKLMTEDIETLMMFYFLFCVSVFLAILVYFPSKPKHPPSASSVSPRVDFKKGCMRILQIKNFWLLLVPYASCVSIQSSFINILGIVLSPLHIGQEMADWIGLYSALSGSISCTLSGILVDRLRCGLKPALVSFVGLSGFFYGWVALMSYGFLSSHLAMVITALIGGSLACNATVPLFFELGCELVYPVSEEVASGVLASSSNLISTLFLLCVSFIKCEKTWVPAVLSCSFLFSVPSLLMMKEVRPRLALDKNSASN